ncbi:MAG: tRNA (guanosine(37)-N1)-methyltransferase TrmD [Hydrogenophilales bacterium CG17_big_fil_post_rev_8_21_14_2_50_63_12]|nr:MAG: tRNA (guanosine(37)-N1)-methyltransferase TrmD [Hydrogenophilales bacterium CG17_big_fil_post_rev_8_21_14_2_50_63_12]PJB03230.1 MAG: tRNA (guanosine(37)-N1)-methyltransferase TrmD [Hydrogenophilales bacterium CG_4_9_14_3_um_filter_63_34]
MAKVTPSYHVITLFPEMFAALTSYGISGRAVKQPLCSMKFWDPRDFTQDNYRTVDDRPFGGGPGMVMLAEPLDLALTAAKTALRREGLVPRLIYLSPQGRRLDQELVEELGEAPALVLLAGRYEGIDERMFERHALEEVSIGDYVLSGGELPAMVLLDALIRRIPGALGHADSAEEDSFADGLLDCPHYTRPVDYLGHPVPEVLRSGNHADVARWRLKQALDRTGKRRPDLLAGRELNALERELLDELEQGAS